VSAPPRPPVSVVPGECGSPGPSTALPASARRPYAGPVALFVLHRLTRLGATEAWERLTTWERHTATVPLTRISVLTAGPPGVGTRFTARTGTRWAGFSDPMRVTVWQPPAGPGAPGRCRLEKTGRVVLGWAEIGVAATERGSAVTWREDLRVRGVPRALDRLTSYAATRVFSRALDALLAG
jgi:hypothetical protein